VNNTSKVVLSVVALMLAACVCLSVICVGAAGLLLITQAEGGPNQPLPTLEDFPIPTLDFDLPTEIPLPELDTPTPRPKPTVAPNGPTPTPLSGKQPGEAAQQTLNTLLNSIVPESNPVHVAQAYKGKGEIAPTVPPPATPWKVGDKKEFWLSNTDTQKYRRVTATLRYQTEHLYFWVDDDAKYNLTNIKKLSDTFEKSIYPTNRKFFGSEWSPGIDGETQLYVLYATNIGKGVAGFFSSIDEIPPEANEYSNAHEMFVISAEASPLNRSYDYGTFAHEFQHMIHFNTDRNEESWVNEGFSELAQLLNKYDTGNGDQVFLSNPDLQLNTWEPDIELNRPHYGASYMFFTYFLGRFGEEATKAVVAHPENGWESIDIVLKDLNLKDPKTGAQLSADDVFADWAIANFVEEKSVAGRLYDYTLYPQAPNAEAGQGFDLCPVESQDETVRQYGTDYIEFSCEGTYTFEFQGAAEAQLLPEGAKSGQFAFWSNRGDESDMTLTREFDFSSVSGLISLKFNAWYDIEENYDYLFVSVSEDGKTWKTLQSTSSTKENPGGANLSWGFTGDSGGWQEEEVDLSAFAGKKIQLRFEYLTDPAVNQNGMLIDDVAVEAVKYQSDFEKDDGGWKAEGFVRVSNAIPQTFRVSLIHLDGAARVEYLPLDATQHGSASLTIGKGERVIVVISGTARFTTQPATYRYTVK